jgi:hypothetical protein
MAKVGRVPEENPELERCYGRDAIPGFPPYPTLFRACSGKPGLGLGFGSGFCDYDLVGGLKKL